MKILDIGAYHHHQWQRRVLAYLVGTGQQIVLQAVILLGAVSDELDVVLCVVSTIRAFEMGKSVLQLVGERSYLELPPPVSIIAGGMLKQETQAIEQPVYFGKTRLTIRESLAHCVKTCVGIIILATQHRLSDCGATEGHRAHVGHVRLQFGHRIRE